MQPNIKQYFIWTMVSILIFSCGCRKEQKKNEEVYSDPAYAIGEITHWVTVEPRTTYHYEYRADGRKYKNKEKAHFGKRIPERLLGERFLVVYLKTDPSKSDMNFGYLIESEAEFDALVQSFENNPPIP